MINLKPLQIANKIIELSGVNVFENSRQRKYIEVRSLLTYMLRNKLNMRWTNIALFYTKNGKPTTHATTIHSCVDYEMHKTHNKKLQEIENMFMFKSEQEIPKIIKGWEWKNKLNKT